LTLYFSHDSIIITCNFKIKKYNTQINERLFGVEKTGEVDGFLGQKKSPKLFGGGLFGLV